MAARLIGGYLNELWESLPAMAALFFCAAALLFFAQRYGAFLNSRKLGKALPPLVLAVSVILGLYYAWEKKSLFDDAFIDGRRRCVVQINRGVIWRIHGAHNLIQADSLLQ